MGPHLSDEERLISGHICTLISGLISVAASAWGTGLNGHIYVTLKDAYSDGNIDAAFWLSAVSLTLNSLTAGLLTYQLLATRGVANSLSEN